MQCVQASIVDIAYIIIVVSFFVVDMLVVAMWALIES